PIDDR
ncbi:hypothetical protein D018_2742B, partial [Vibrio parahaemolyticus VP2007-007]